MNHVHAHLCSIVLGTSPVIERLRCGEIRLMSSQDISPIPVILQMGAA